MNIQQKKLLAIAAVVLFHGTVISVMLAQHGCKSAGTKPSAADAPAPIQPAPVAPATPAPDSLTAANNGFVEPTRPPPETPVAPVPVAQFSEALPTPTPLSLPPVLPAPTPAPATPTPAPAPMTVTYVVSRGESLASIARKNGITREELLAANPKLTNPALLQPNQTLNIPNAKPATTAPAPVAADAADTYKVAPGDNLSKIAAKYHTTVKALQELNGMKTTSLRSGQVLKVPDTTTTSSPVMPTPSHLTDTAPTSDGDTYTVKSGDSLDKIARTLHVSASDLMSLNGLTDATARSLRPGHVLKLPSGVHAPDATAAASTAMPMPMPGVTPSSSSSPPPVTMPVMAVPASGSGPPPLTPVQ